MLSGELRVQMQYFCIFVFLNGDKSKFAKYPYLNSLNKHVFLMLCHFN